MDEMKIKLSTKLMRKIVAKLISRSIYKKLGYRINFQLNDLDVNLIDDNVSIKLNAEANLSYTEFAKIVNNINSGC